MLPLSNNLAVSATDPIHHERYPLKVVLCEDCGLSQLSIVIDPRVMYCNYVYRSSISQGYKDHCRKWAEGMKRPAFHIDIAGNDGALLHEFKQIHDHRVLNIDPAKNLVDICEAKGVRQYTAFWGVSAAQHLITTGWPKADLITATNVFAHVDDVREFMEAVKMVLSDDGVLQLEFPYLIDFIEKGEFDTVYFEHLSYFSIRPLYHLCAEVGLSLMSVSHHHIHGGSVRVTIGRGEPDDSVVDYLQKEIAYSTIEPYRIFAGKVDKVIARVRAFMLSHDNIAAFAASAKGNTLLNCVGPVPVRYIVDETPEKIGRFSPGTRIPIVDMATLKSDPPEYLIILAWNFAEEIMSKCRMKGYRGKFVLPLTGEVV
jgi:hypothetical protein